MIDSNQGEIRLEKIGDVLNYEALMELTGIMSALKVGSQNLVVITGNETST
jgi:hypothetical protein